eukprot:305359-Rhodomonas_salina.1
MVPAYAGDHPRDNKSAFPMGYCCLKIAAIRCCRLWQPDRQNGGLRLEYGYRTGIPLCIGAS